MQEGTRTRDMTTTVLRSPFPSFRSDEDAADKPAPKLKSIRRSTTSGKGHPNPASKALKYAHQIYGNGSSTTKAATTNASQDDAVSPLMSRY